MVIRLNRFKVAISARSFGQESQEPYEILHAAGCDVVKSPLDRGLTSAELAHLIEDADALIAGNDRVDAAAINAAPRLKVISRYGVGLDSYDLEAAKAHGIVVTITRGANDNSVADLAMAFILGCARDLPKAVGLVKQGSWTRVRGVEIWQKTLGVVGTGRIGRGVVRRASGFEMRILCYDTIQDDKWARAAGAGYVGLNDLLQQSDFVTLHVPLIPSTKSLISRRELALMKPGSYLINTARGGIVDEEALYEALTSGGIAGAGLDVLANEPDTSSPLIGLDNVLVTAHVAAQTRDAINNMSMMAAQNVIDVLTGKDSPNAVTGETA